MCTQDFLRNIPGSLLCCELYEEWLEALEDEDEEEEQVQDVKRCEKDFERQKGGTEEEFFLKILKIFLE